MPVTFYRRLKHRDTWHFHVSCQHYKHIITEVSYMMSILRNTKPRSGELCNECQAKSRADKARARKRGKA